MDIMKSTVFSICVHWTELFKCPLYFCIQGREIYVMTDGSVCEVYAVEKLPKE